MSAESKGILTQIAVGVVTGILVGVLAGSGTAYFMVNHLSNKVDMHIVASQAADEQINKDVARLEVKDTMIEGNFTGMNNSMASMATSIAVLAEKFTQLESGNNGG